jgi:hypothetical protein
MEQFDSLNPSLGPRGLFPAVKSLFVDSGGHSKGRYASSGNYCVGRNSVQWHPMDKRKIAQSSHVSLTPVWKTGK